MKISVDYVGNYEPSHGSSEAAAYDLRAVTDDNEIWIMPGESVTIKSGIAAQPPEGFAGILMIRSGISKKGLRLSTGVSLIDRDYTGDISCCLFNDSMEPQKISKGDRIAQIAYIPVASVDWIEVDELSPTERGSGGFGSTGVR